MYFMVDSFGVGAHRARVHPWVGAGRRFSTSVCRFSIFFFSERMAWAGYGRKASKSYTRSASTAYLDEKRLLYVAAAQAARFTKRRGSPSGAVHHGAYR
jgi:hypothetical protein